MGLQVLEDRYGIGQCSVSFCSRNKVNNKKGTLENKNDKKVRLKDARKRKNLNLNFYRLHYKKVNLKGC